MKRLQRLLIAALVCFTAYAYTQAEGTTTPEVTSTAAPAGVPVQVSITTGAPEVSGPSDTIRISVTPATPVP